MSSGARSGSGSGLADLVPADGATAGAAGVLPLASRADHAHRTVTGVAPLPDALLASLGSSTLGARADHAHAIGDETPRANNKWHPAQDCHGLVAGAPALGTLYAIPWVTNGETLSGLGVEVTITQANRLGRFGLAYPGSDRMPGARAADFGTVDLSVVGGGPNVRQLVVNTAVPAGFYFLMFLVDGAGGAAATLALNNGDAGAGVGHLDRRVGLDATPTLAAFTGALGYVAAGVAVGAIPAVMPAMASTALPPMLWTRKSV